MLERAGIIDLIGLESLFMAEEVLRSSTHQALDYAKRYLSNGQDLESHARYSAN